MSVCGCPFPPPPASFASRLLKGDDGIVRWMMDECLWLPFVS